MLKGGVWLRITSLLRKAGANEANRYLNLEISITDREIIWSSECNNSSGQKEQKEEYKLSINQKEIFKEIVKIHDNHNNKLRELIKNNLEHINNRSYYYYALPKQENELYTSYRFVISAKQDKQYRQNEHKRIMDIAYEQITQLQEIIIDFRANKDEHPQFKITANNIGAINFALMNKSKLSKMSKYKESINELLNKSNKQNNQSLEIKTEEIIDLFHHI